MKSKNILSCLLVIAIPPLLGCTRKMGFKSFGVSRDSAFVADQGQNDNNQTDSHQNDNNQTTINEFSRVSEIKCELRNDRVLNNIYENGIAFDPKTSEIVHTGGHVNNSYAQNSYTYLYSTKDFTTRQSKNKVPPPRQCLMDGTFISSLGKAAFAHGNTAHGSMSFGYFKEGFTKIGLADAVGSPWVFDAIEETWEMARPLGLQFDRRHHAPISYNEFLDAVVSMGDQNLLIYYPRLNQVTQHLLPAELIARSFYGIASNPLTGEVLVFGGNSGGLWDFKADTRFADYNKYIQNDTWIFDPRSKAWSKISEGPVPPKGLPRAFGFSAHSMIYHPNSNSALIRLIPINEFVDDFKSWPAAEFWSFSFESKKWTKISASQSPKFQGLMNWDSVNNQLVILGGGEDAVARVTDSRQMHTCRFTEVYEKGTDPSLLDQKVSNPQLISKDDQSYVISWSNPSSLKHQVYRAEIGVLPLKLEKVAETTAGQVIDTNNEKKRFTYYLSRSGHLRSQVILNGYPIRPEGLTLSVNSGSEVSLTWKSNPEEDLIGYHVYRFKGGEISKATGTRITSAPILATQYVDKQVDLTDKIAQFYVVTAVNKAGVESGFSAWKSSFPEIPISPKVKLVDEKTILLKWSWPNQVKVKGFRIYYNPLHINTNGLAPEEVFAWYDSWLPGELVTGTEFTFKVSDANLKSNHYFYLRAVNVLDQEGFMSDIFSPKDWKFPPHDPNW